MHRRPDEEETALGDIKSAYERALERMKEKGIKTEETSLTDDQKNRMGEIRREFEAKTAELEIMLKSEARAARSPEDRAKVEAHFADEKASLKRQMEERLEAVRKES